MKCDKALVVFYQLRGSVGKTWGVTPLKVAMWMYTTVIRPVLTYAAVIWCPRVDKKSASKKLEHIHRVPKLVTPLQVS